MKAMLLAVANSLVMLSKEMNIPSNRKYLVNNGLRIPLQIQALPCAGDVLKAQVSTASKIKAANFIVIDRSYSTA